MPKGPLLFVYWDVKTKKGPNPFILPSATYHFCRYHHRPGRDGSIIIT